ncbi:hypothetical protein SmJEL517_g00924 [Synchytrium microbalum]|uniref:Vacuolar protein sorting-associated protein 45 n=1 Tax=Synchytrium microbalum TaxID=1806994 RepID=A0A507C671_9FUNG|nr:uncharacterized protein SmJEL517_g00924 [Synchytrium microbalum]TPX37090.1 hypothetical protein SmJEL517_g00924 [Synchytrium microbalum]
MASGATATSSSNALSGLDAVKAVQQYINKMVTEVSGMKVLLLDAETTPIVSVVLTQSNLLSKEVYLIDRVDNKQREKMKHLKYFSNVLKKSAIERLAEVDEHEVVREVQEYFADFLAVNSDLASLGLSPPTHPLFIENASTWDPKTLTRTSEGIISLLLALKKKPLIRYETKSVLAKKLGQEVQYMMTQEGGLFDFRKTDTPPILLLLDRRGDPVTPLLNQWTYQAMVHELMGITNGRVDLADVPDVRPELKEVVLNSDQDPFYKKSLYLNMGDLGANIKSYVEEYQTKHKSSAQIDSIADMKRFVEEYPEFRKLSGNVTKHVTLVGELSRLVDRYSLLEVGELEQSLAVSENHNNDLKTLQKLISQTNIPDDNKLRLVLLYALRYEKSERNSVAALMDALAGAGVSEKKIGIIGAMIQYAGADQRQEDLFMNTDVTSKIKGVFKGLKGVENVYTQHTPLIVQTIDALVKGRLNTTSYPYVEGGTKDKPQDIIIFMVGGATYAEGREVARLNTVYPGVRIILAGTTIHNSRR